MRWNKNIKFVAGEKGDRGEGIQGLKGEPGKPGNNKFYKVLFYLIIFILKVCLEL